MVLKKKGNRKPTEGFQGWRLSRRGGKETAEVGKSGCDKGVKMRDDPAAADGELE